MAHAIKTVLTYNLDGATKDFNIPFEYLARKFVVVTLIGVDRKVLVLNQDYRFATRTTISTTLAWGAAQGYNQIEIRRYTSATERLVDFTDGSIMRAYDLNVAQVQTLHVAEEARDLTADTIGVNNDGHLDARGRRIVNLADAVDDSDAISFGQVKRMNENSWQARNEALQFRNEAEQFKAGTAEDRNAVASDKSITENLKNQTQGFRNEAEQFKNQTATDRNAAGVSANSAAMSQAAAATSEINAANSATSADNSAASAKRDAAEALKVLESSGNVPVGTIAMITHGNIPPGWIRCGERFDVNTYPALAKLFPDGITPSFDDRFPMGNSQGAPNIGAHGDQTMPAHQHNFRVDVSGSTAAAGAYHGGTSQDGNHSHATSLPIQNGQGGAYTGRLVGGGTDGQGYISTWDFNSNWTGLHTHSFDIPDHAHALNASGSGVTDPTGIGDSPYLRPYHTVVMFIIKAAQGVAEADTAMQVVGTIVGRVDAVESWMNNFKPYVESVLPVASNGGPWNKTKFQRVTDIGYNQYAVMSGSSWGEIVTTMNHTGQLVGQPGIITFDIAFQFTDSTPLINAAGIWNPRVFSRVTFFNGTNSEDYQMQPVSYAAHAMNGWVPRVCTLNRYGANGGQPVIAFGFFKDGAVNTINQGTVDAAVRLVHVW